MNPRLVHLLMCLYPRAWRDRYGAEFEALLQSGRGDLWTVGNVFRSALHEHIAPTPLLMVNRYSVIGMAKHPSAFLPPAMSLTALAVVLVHIAVYGVAREADEGATAHIWQLLMAGQMPVLVFFALKWLPRAPRQALYVLALQAGAALASMTPVFLLNL